MSLVAPLYHLEAIDRPDLNRLIDRWGHPLGRYSRPRRTAEAHHVLMHLGRPVAVSASGDSPARVLGNTGLETSEVIELCRVSAELPEYASVLLRLWRLGVFPALADKRRRRFAVTFALGSTGWADDLAGDGWLRVGRGRGAGQSAPERVTVWAWPPAALDEVVTRRRARTA